MWLRDARVVDPAAGTVSEPQTLEVRDGRIALVGGRPPIDADVLDVRGKFLAPGLISCHTHLQGLYPYSLRSENEAPAVTALRAARRARSILALGVTTVRSVHEQHAVDVAVRDVTRADATAGPQIFSGGRALTTTGGHGYGLGCRVADGPEDFLTAARTELSANTDHVKIFLSGGLARSGERLDSVQMAQDEVAAVVQAATERGKYVVAHAGSSASIRAGLISGVRSFEHAYELDTVTAQAIAASNAFLTPTLVVTHALDWMLDVGFPAEAVERSRQHAEQHMNSAVVAHRAGVTLVSGTDMPPDAVTDGTSMAIRELELAVMAGLSPAEALRTATTNAARLLEAADLGRLAEGARADLILLERNPLDDISALRDVRGVIAGGEVIRWEA